MNLKSDYAQAKKLQPEIAKLEDVVKKQDEAQKKKDAEEKAAAKPSVVAATLAKDAAKTGRRQTSGCKKLADA